MRGKFLRARDEEEFVVGTAKNNASDVGVDLCVDDLLAVGSTDIDEGMELDADRAL